VSETIETNAAASLARGSAVPRQRLALLAVLVAAAAATVLIPWLVTSPAPTAAMGPGAAPAGSSTDSEHPTPSKATDPSRFTPIAVEAEYAANIVSPGATVDVCLQCSGRYRVGSLTGPVGLVVPIEVPTGGTRTVTVLYEAPGVRHLVVAVNDVVVFDRDVIGLDGNTPQSVSFVTFIPAGAVRVALDVAEHVSGPDIDKITIS
jgi:hypothetical protein